MEAKKDNVIHFPGRVREELSAQSADPSPKTPSPKRRLPLWMPAVLIAVLVGTYLGNRINMSSDSAELASTSGRGIASVSESIRYERDANWEHKVARDLSQRPRRDIASIHVGRTPSAEERLRFQDLNSQYAVIMNNGKLVEISLPQASEASNEERDNLFYLSDGRQFIERHRELMPDGYEIPVRLGRQIVGREIFETYALMNSQSEKIGEIQVGLDNYGRLISMKVQSGSED